MNNRTPFYISAINECKELSLFLAAKGACVNVADIVGNTPLLTLALNKKTEHVAWLLQNICAISF